MMKYHKLIGVDANRLIRVPIKSAEFNFKRVSVCKDLHNCANLAAFEIEFGQIFS